MIDVDYLYDLEYVKSQTVSAYSMITDPFDTSEDPEPMLGHIIRGEPTKIALFDKPLGVMMFVNGPEKSLGLAKTEGSLLAPRKQVYQMTVGGAILLFVQGDNDPADIELTHLSDVINAAAKHSDFLNIPGTVINPVSTGDSINWRPINVTLENMKKPLKCMTAAVKFSLQINSGMKH